VSLCADQLVDASETAVQTSDVSGMLVHVSGVSDSVVHFRTPEMDIPESDAIRIKPGCTLTEAAAMLDSALIEIA